MIDHFERLALAQDNTLRAKRLVALIAVFLGVAMFTAGGAMVLAFLLAIAEN